MTLTAPLAGVSYLDSVAQCTACWSLQLNAVAASGKAPGLEQFVVGYYNGEMYVSIDFFRSGEGGSDFILQGASPSLSIPQSELVSGFTVSIALEMNSTQNVQGVTVSYYSSPGHLMAQSIVGIADATNVITGGYSVASLETQIVGFQLNLVGDGNSDSAVFSSGAGTFAYASLTALTFSLMHPDTFAWVGFDGNSAGAFTAETSNEAYGSVSDATSSSSSTTSSSSTFVPPTPPCVSLGTPTIVCTEKPSGFGMDVGPALFSYSASKISWATSGSNITLGLPTLLLGVGPSAIITTHCTPTFSTTFTHNSTTYIWTMVAASAVLCLTASLTPVMHVYVKNVTGSYNEKEIIVTGTTTRTGTAVLLQNQISFALKSNYPESICDVGCTSAHFGNAAFDWSAITGTNTAYNNQTDALSVSSTPSLLASVSYLFDPLALDGSGVAENSLTSSLGVSLTTSGTSDVILLFASINTARNGASDCNTPTATGLTFNSRYDGINSGIRLCEFYATDTSTFSGTITLTTTATTALALVAMGVSGANTASPFDTGTNVGTSHSTSGTTHASNSFSTVNANDFLVEADSTAGDPTFGTLLCAGSTATVVQDELVPSWNALHTQYYIVSSTQTSQTCSDVLSVGESGRTGIDAIQQASVSGPTIIQSKSCTGTGAKGNCAFTSNTAAGDTSLVLAFNTGATSVSSINDSQSLGYAFIVSEDSGTIGDAEGWMACQTLTAAPDTVSVNHGISVTWAIILYELSPTDCAPSSSTGTGTGTTSASVSSYVPINPSLIIGGINAVVPVSFTVSAGAGYTEDQSILMTTTNVAAGEHITNLGTSETTPFTIGSATSSYNEVSMAFQTSATMVSITKSVSATASASPAVQLKAVHDVAQTVTATPKAVLSDVKQIAASVTGTAKVLVADVKQVLDSVLVTPSVNCLVNGLSCANMHYVLTVAATLSATASVSADDVHSLLASVSAAASIVSDNVKQVEADIDVSPSLSCLLNAGACVIPIPPGGTGPISGCGLLGYPLCNPPTTLPTSPGKSPLNPVIIPVALVAAILLVAIIRYDERRPIPTTTVKKPPVSRPSIQKKELDRPTLKRPKLRKLRKYFD